MVPLWRNARSAAQWDWDVGGGMGMDPAAQTPNPVRRWDSALLVRIGARGFEPRTSCSRSRRANRAALRPVCRRGRNVMCPPAFGRPRRGCPGPLSPQPMDVTRQQPLLIRLDPTLRARFGRDRRMPFTPRGSSRSPAGGGSTRRSRPQPRATGRTQAPSPTWVCRASWRGYWGAADQSMELEDRLAAVPQAQGRRRGDYAAGRVREAYRFFHQSRSDQASHVPKNSRTPAARTDTTYQPYSSSALPRCPTSYPPRCSPGVLQVPRQKTAHQGRAAGLALPLSKP
jgi:hypothetical protein